MSCNSQFLDHTEIRHAWVIEKTELREMEDLTVHQGDWYDHVFFDWCT